MDNLTVVRDKHRRGGGDVDLFHVPRRLVEAVRVNRVLAALAMAHGIGTTTGVDVQIASDCSAALVLDALVCETLGAGAKGTALDGIIGIEAEDVGDNLVTEAIGEMSHERRNVAIVIEGSSRCEEFGCALVRIGSHNEGDIRNLTFCDGD